MFEEWESHCWGEEDVCKRPRECEELLPQPKLTTADITHFAKLFVLEPAPRVTTKQLLEAVFANSLIFGSEQDILDWTHARRTFIIPSKPVSKNERERQAINAKARGSQALNSAFIDAMNEKRETAQGEMPTDRILESVRNPTTYITDEQFMNEPRESLDAYAAWYAQQPWSSSVATYAQLHAPAAPPKKKVKATIVIDLTGDD